MGPNGKHVHTRFIIGDSGWSCNFDFKIYEKEELRS